MNTYLLFLFEVFARRIAYLGLYYLGMKRSWIH
jgi:hypothetical protein